MKPILIVIFSLLTWSCSKSEVFNSADSSGFDVLTSDSFSYTWSMVGDSIQTIANPSAWSLGVSVHPDFGTSVYGLYTSFETSSSSRSFNFSRVDSIVLIAPYINTFRNGTQASPMTLNVYELTSTMTTANAFGNQDPTYNATPLLTIPNFTFNTTDSFMDGNIKLPPALRLKFDNSLAQRLIAPGTYSDNAALHNVFKGFLIKPEASTSTGGGPIMSCQSNQMRLVIYGKDANNLSVVSVFNTSGATNSFTRIYAATTNSLVEDIVNSKNFTNKMYLMSHDGYRGILDFSNLAVRLKNYNIIKAELIVNVIDTSHSIINRIGILSRGNATSAYGTILDQKNISFYYPNKIDTTIDGVACSQIRLDISQDLMGHIENNATQLQFALLANNLATNWGGSLANTNNFIQTRKIIAMNGNAKPKLRINYLKK